MRMEAVIMQTNSTLTAELSDIKQCENEPLNFIGSIQGHGCVMCFTLPDRRIQACSENIEKFLEISHKNVVSRRPKAGLSLKYKFKNQELQAYVYATGGLFFLELEREIKNDEIDHESLDTAEQDVIDCLVQIRDSEKLEDIGNSVCRAVRAITGMDRVMLYRFIAPYWHGEVIAEDRVMNSHSFLQHRFPASDIPRIARDLYLRNSVRIIADVNASPSKISPGTNPLNKEPLDLSDSRLRAASPIHLEYLRNMKIGASYSFAIIVKGELWGLIACHHFQPILIPANKRNSCELLANAFAARAPLIEQINGQQQRITFDSLLRKVIEKVCFGNDPVADLFKHNQVILNTFNATGVALVSQQTMDFAGLCPKASQLTQIAEALRIKMTAEHKATLVLESISELNSDWKNISQIACGVLAVKVDDIDNGIFMLFRTEHAETIVWGGDPRKQLDKKNFTGRIHPRASFDAWEETIHLRSSEWKRYEVDGIQFIKELIFETLAPKQKIIQELTFKRNALT
jgi:chemotaxis family two-component system sensor kinase Cph1